MEQTTERFSVNYQRPQNIINSLLDNDWYKFTMLQAFLHYGFNHYSAKYKFTCRDSSIKFGGCYKKIIAEIENLCTLRFSEEELNYLASFDNMSFEFIEYLRNFKFDRKQIDIKLSINEELLITLEGALTDITLYEIYLLVIISEAHCQSITAGRENEFYTEGEKRLNEKIKFFSTAPQNINIVEFGTRRRFSGSWQNYVIERLKSAEYPNLIGTSNTFNREKL